MRENHPEKKIFVTGNTAIDALKQTVQADYHHEVLDLVKSEHRMILVIMHRQENQGKPMRHVFAVMRQVVDEHDDVEIVYPVHLSPAVQAVAQEGAGRSPSDSFDCPT